MVCTLDISIPSSYPSFSSSSSSNIFFFFFFLEPEGKTKKRYTRLQNSSESGSHSNDDDDDEEEKENFPLSMISFVTNRTIFFLNFKVKLSYAFSASKFFSSLPSSPPFPLREEEEEGDEVPISEFG